MAVASRRRVGCITGIPFSAHSADSVYFLPLVFRSSHRLWNRSTLVPCQILICERQFCQCSLYCCRLVEVASLNWEQYLPFFHHQPLPAVFALMWPFVVGLVGIPGKVGTIELAFAKSIGFVSPDAEL